MIPEKTDVLTPHEFPALPKSWSELSWQQLCDVWSIKQRYGENADAERVSVLLSFLGLKPCNENTVGTDMMTGEKIYMFRTDDGRCYTARPRELAYYAKKALPWVDYPYGDPGEKEQLDDKGHVIKERREAVVGYVSPMRDAMILPVEYAKVYGRYFSLPQMACNNLTWQQYRALQSITPQLFTEGIGVDQAVTLQSQFLANILVPRTLAMVDSSGGSIRFRPHYEYRYSAVQADGLSKWFEKKMRKEIRRRKRGLSGISLTTLFHISFQTYQTALTYYSVVYPLLFADSGKVDQLRDALTGEVGTINTIMKYAGYAEQQQVYDSNLPFVFDILNTMTKEAKEIEKMNSKIKK